MSADVLVWLDEDSLDHRRRARNALLVSLAIHGMIVAAFAVSQPARVPPLIEVLSVDLVAAAPAARSHARPAPAPSVSPTPAEAPPPAPPEPAPPPLAKAPVQVLPEEAPGRIRKVEPKPKQVAKIKPEPKAAPRRPTREKEPSYEDVMASLSDEFGSDEKADLLRPAVAPVEESSGEAEPSEATSRPGAKISSEDAAWMRKTERLIQDKFVTLSNLRGRGLSTLLELNLAASGDLIGRPRVVQSSGDPFFDDNAINALLKAAPLPPVPKPGIRNFIFRSEAD